MSHIHRRIDSRAAQLAGRARPGGLFLGLLAANAAAWLWAAGVCGGDGVLLGTGVVAFVLGLRHAVDADHIAAIDNVTRKLMQAGGRPLTVGLWFSLGHSTVVVAACAAVALASVAFKDQLARWAETGGLIGTGVSIVFLFVIALANLATLSAVWRDFRRARGPERDEAGPAAAAALAGGLAARLLRPLMGVITRPWHMYALGFLFGLGFDTASEISLLAISGTQASHAATAATIMVFPALFTAGMSLVDTADGMFMVGAYGAAAARPGVRPTYNLVVTLISIGVAVIVGGLEALDLARERLDLGGAFWGAVGHLNAHFGVIGVLIVATFVVCWGARAMIEHLRGGGVAPE